MNDGAQREMSLEEFCGRLPPNHRVNKELFTLKIRLEELETREKILEAHLKQAEKALNSPSNREIRNVYR